jgi:Putative restriction endonuclease
MPELTPAVNPPRRLIEGQRLGQPEFHALYEAMPPGTRAERINGVVFIPSPVGPPHGRAHVPTLVWLSYDQENTSGVEALDNTSAALGLKSEPQPDCLLRILSEYGGRTDADQRFVRGVPELLVEVAHSSRYNDLGPKFDDYERVGVQEYVVHAFNPTEVLWFVLRNGHFIELPPGPDGTYRSEVFPGLWLDPQALIKGDTRRLRAVLDLGFATPEHTEFLACLSQARRAD